MEIDYCLDCKTPLIEPVPPQSERKCECCKEHKGGLHCSRCPLFGSEYLNQHHPNYIIGSKKFKADYLKLCSPKLKYQHTSSCYDQEDDLICEQPNQEWQDRFDKKFKTTWIQGYGSMIGLNPNAISGQKTYLVNADEVKQFISQTLLLEKQRIKKEATEWVEFMLAGEKLGNEAQQIYDRFLKLLEDKDGN